MSDTNDIVLLKLSNGMDVMGKVARESGTTLCLEKVRQVLYQQMGNETRVGFGPFLIPVEDASVPIALAHVIVRTIASENITEAYKRAVSPIQLATTLPKDLQ